MKNVILFFRKIHLFLTALFCFWNYAVVASLILVAPRSHIYLRNVPWPILLPIYPIFIVIGIMTIQWFVRKPLEKFSFWMTLGWNFVLPIIWALFFVPTVDIFYEIGGGFMPGLEVLGLAIGGAITGAIAIIGGIIFAIVGSIYKKRVMLSKEPSEKLRIAGDVLNILTLLLLILGVVAFLASLLSQPLNSVREKREEVMTNRFMQEIAEIHSETAVDDLQSESITYIVAMQCMEEKGFHILEDSELDDITAQVFEEGYNRYKELAARYEVQKQVDFINSHAEYDYKNKTVAWCFELETIDRPASAYKDFWCKVVYDEDLKIKEIIFEED